MKQLKIGAIALFTCGTVLLTLPVLAQSRTCVKIEDFFERNNTCGVAAQPDKAGNPVADGGCDGTFIPQGNECRKDDSGNTCEERDRLRLPWETYDGTCRYKISANGQGGAYCDMGEYTTRGYVWVPQC